MVSTFITWSYVGDSLMLNYIVWLADARKLFSPCGSIVVQVVDKFFYSFWNPSYEISVLRNGILLKTTLCSTSTQSCIHNPVEQFWSNSRQSFAFSLKSVHHCLIASSSKSLTEIFLGICPSSPLMSSSSVCHGLAWPVSKDFFPIPWGHQLIWVPSLRDIEACPNASIPWASHIYTVTGILILSPQLYFYFRYEETVYLPWLSLAWLKGNVNFNLVFEKFSHRSINKTK